MIENTTCFVCFEETRQTYNIVNTQLHIIYEHLTDIKVENDSLMMCFMCLRRLQQSNLMYLLAEQAQHNHSEISNSDQMSESSEASCPTNNSDLTFVYRNGGKVLLRDGHQYSKHRLLKNGLIKWRCINWRKKCKGGLCTSHDGSVSEEQRHTVCEPNEAEKELCIKMQEDGNKVTLNQNKINAESSTIWEMNPSTPPYTHSDLVVKLEPGAEEPFQGHDSDDNETEIITAEAVYRETDDTEAYMEVKTPSGNSDVQGGRNNCESVKNIFYKFQSDIIVHNHESKKIISEYDGEVCPYSARTESIIDEYRRASRCASDKQCYVCKHCPYVSRTKRNVAVYEKKYTGRKIFTCDVCDRTFGSNSILTKHKKIHSDKKPYACHICDRRFIYNCVLTIHMRTHTGVKPFTCDICNRPFASSGYLKIHRRMHVGERPYTCDVCNDTFTHGTALKKHKRKHTGEKPFTCHICNRSLSSNDVLKKHIRSHTGEKPFSCDICFKTFTSSSYVTIHKRIHTGERPYECETCGSNFNNFSSYNVHKRSHTGVRPYGCDVCERRFSNSGDLKKHKRTHTGEKPYSCERCDRKFTSAGNLSMHRRTHSRQQLECN